MAGSDVVSVLAAAESEDRLAELRAMRRVIASAIDGGVPARDLAALTRRQIEISKQIDELLAKAEQESGSGEAADESFDPEAV